MTSPLVSIVIPTFNSERFLRECLDSVINQDYANLEIIIVDGSSDDQTLVILQEYSRIISTLISEDDTGISISHFEYNTLEVFRPQKMIPE